MGEIQMKNIFLFLLGVLATSQLATAELKKAPFLPEIDRRFHALESGSGFAAGAIGAEDIATDGVGAAEIAAGAVGTSEIATDGVDSAEIATDAVAASEIAAGAVGSSEIAAGGVIEADVVAQTADGLHLGRWARATFDFADGDLALGAHLLGVSLPAKAIIMRSFIRIDTQLVDTGTCTYAISCEDANNIKTATDISGTAAAGFIEGQSTGAASAFVGSIAAACEITGTMADGGSCVPSAGKGTVFVQYVVHN